MADVHAESPRTDQELVAEYVRTRTALRARGILRADRSLAGEYAEYLAERHLGVRLEPDLVNAGFDGIKDGERYQIKARTVASPTSPTSWDFREEPDGFDFLLAFAFDRDYRVIHVLRVPIDGVRDLAHRHASRWGFRWNKRTRSDPRVEVLDLPVAMRE